MSGRTQTLVSAGSIATGVRARVGTLSTLIDVWNTRTVRHSTCKAVNIILCNYYNIIIAIEHILQSLAYTDVAQHVGLVSSRTSAVVAADGVDADLVVATTRRSSTTFVYICFIVTPWY